MSVLWIITFANFTVLLTFHFLQEICQFDNFFWPWIQGSDINYTFIIITVFGWRMPCACNKKEWIFSMLYFEYFQVKISLNTDIICHLYSPKNKNKLIIESYYFFWLKILPRSNHISSMETMHFNCIFFFKEGYPDLLNIFRKLY